MVRLFFLDLQHLWRDRTHWTALLLFFVTLLVVLPFAIGPDPLLLQSLAPGFIWLATLLMCLLASDRFLVRDQDDGTLDLMVLSPHPLPVLLLSKILAETTLLVTALLALLLPASVLFHLSVGSEVLLASSLIMGVPSLMLLGGTASTIALALPKSPALLSLLLVPFSIPVLIFGVSAAMSSPMSPSAIEASDNLWVIFHAARSPLLLLIAYLVFLLPTAPWLMASALKNAQS